LLVHLCKLIYLLSLTFRQK